MGHNVFGFLMKRKYTGVAHLYIPLFVKPAYHTHMHTQGEGFDLSFQIENLHDE